MDAAELSKLYKGLNVAKIDAKQAAVIEANFLRMLEDGEVSQEIIDDLLKEPND